MPGPGRCCDSSVSAAWTSTEAITPLLQWTFCILNSLNQDKEIKGVAVSPIRVFLPVPDWGFVVVFASNNSSK